MVVPKEEATTPGSVAVAIHVEEQIPTLRPAQQQRLRCEDALMHLWGRVAVAAVQVAAQRVRAVVPPSHAIWVQHWHYLEDELPPELRGSRVVREHKLQETVGRELPRRLAWVHARGDEAHRPAGKAQRWFGRRRRLRPPAVQCLLHLLRQLVARPPIPSVLRLLGDRQHLDPAALRRPGHGLPAIVDAGACSGDIVMPIPILKVVQLRLPALRGISLVVRGRGGGGARRHRLGQLLR
mmetsp:Transcript_103195/g.274381  ORF Transcript_103195/g.274381 Transcript_103195/m.274381 type:complete len:238 (-) Transcript_103195:818-1531(-)